MSESVVATGLHEETEDAEISTNGEMKENKDVNNSRGAVWPQVFIAFLVDICAFLVGVSAGFMGIFLPDMRNDPGIQATFEQGSWIASWQIVGAIPGCLLASWTAEKFGRLRTLKLCCVPLIIGWAIMGCSRNLIQLHVGSFLVGFGDGMNAGCKQVYLSEISDIYLRGMISASTITAIHFGMLVTFLSALCFTWRTVAIISSVLSLVALISYFFIVESPTWLVKKNQKEKAEKALRKIRGSSYNVTLELDEIEQKHLLNQKESEDASGNWKESLLLYFSPQSLKAFGILLAIFTTLRFSGQPAIISYTKDIFDKASGGRINSYSAIIIFGSIRLVVTILGNYLVKLVTKKMLYGVSGIGMTVSLCALATYNYILENNDNNLGFAWIPAMCICIFTVFVTPGYIMLSWVLIGELFPQRTRGAMSSLFALVGYILYFGAIKSYPFLLSNILTYGVFWLYSAIAFVGTVIVVLILPETDGKSLNQIEDDLCKRDDETSC